MIYKVVVLGGGTMGNDIVHIFTKYGFKVSLVHISSQAHKKA